MKLNVFILLMAFIAAGCNYKLREIPKSKDKPEIARTDSESSGEESNKKSAATADDGGVEGGELLIGDSGALSTYNCNKREVQFDEDSTANNVFLKGECKKIIVDGVSNTINVKSVGEIVVKGISNKVIYESGIGGGKPKISKSGTSTSVEQKKSESN